jgi:hypothetical protein
MSGSMGQDAEEHEPLFIGQGEEGDFHFVFLGWVGM